MNGGDAAQTGSGGSGSEGGLDLELVLWLSANLSAYERLGPEVAWLMFSLSCASALLTRPTFFLALMFTELDCNVMSVLDDAGLVASGVTAADLLFVTAVDTAAEATDEADNNDAPVAMCAGVGAGGGELADRRAASAAVEVAV